MTQKTLSLRTEAASAPDKRVELPKEPIQVGPCSDVALNGRHVPTYRLFSREAEKGKHPAWNTSGCAVSVLRP